MLIMPSVLYNDRIQIVHKFSRIVLLLIQKRFTDKVAISSDAQATITEL